MSAVHRRPLEAVSGRTIPDMFKMSEAQQGLIMGWIAERKEALEKNGGVPNQTALLDQLLTSPEYQDAGEEKGM
jgi:hypothetical protein